MSGRCAWVVYAVAVVLVCALLVSLLVFACLVLLSRGLVGLRFALSLIVFVQPPACDVVVWHLGVVISSSFAISAISVVGHTALVAG